MAIKKIGSGNPPVCPLCASTLPVLFHADCGLRQGWDSLHCLRCDLLFRHESSWLSPQAEAAHYRNHKNSFEDAGYRRFLQPVVDAVREVLPRAASGLDYGSGPCPVLASMLEEVGFQVVFHDPFFSPRQDLEKASFDFISCTEVVEHFKNPAHEFGYFYERLRSGGYLFVKTQIRACELAPETFETWYYRLDPTHIAFYSRKTLNWIASSLGFSSEFLSNTLVRFRKV